MYRQPCLWLFAAALAAQTPPSTTPEATGHARTSTAAEVRAFLTACRKLEHGERLTIAAIGKSHEGRELLRVRAALPDVDEPQALRALVIANIHAGEVEGKEAVQALLREIALGEHTALLQQLVLYVLPIYNVDGNERIDARNRPEQNGPDAVGQRANGQGFDLNRDFVKAEAPETRALLAQFAALDPHLFMDLHTTDGSWHGYHLTYAPSLCTNVDPAVSALSRTLLETANAALAAMPERWQTFDYGNFETRDWEGSGAPESARGQRGWWTYDHRARYGVNYFGLRNRIGILSEAYSNCAFADRIAVTRAFVLAVLQAAVDRRATVRDTCAAADARVANPVAGLDFGFDTTFAEPQLLPVLVGDCERIPLGDGRGVRLARKDVATPEKMPVVRAFTSRRQLPLPAAWALPDPPPAVIELLARHGVVAAPLAAARQVDVERFAISKQRRPKRPFQGHQELVLEGTWQPAAATELPAGTLWIDAHQPLGRLAAQLLEATSEDSLSSWNFLDSRTDDTYPVLRVIH